MRTHRPYARIFERLSVGGLALCACVSIVLTGAILATLLSEAWRFFSIIPLPEMLFGTHWSPQMAGHGGTEELEAFGALPLFAGTLLITMIALLVAVPVGLLSAIYLVEYADRSTRAWAKPALEMLAGIPTVVYGYVAIVSLTPLLRNWGASMDISVASESALGAGLVMGIMIIPFISSLADDILHAVPQTLRDGSLALGATQAETIRHVVMAAAMPGLVGALLLAFSRAVGETMIVVMAAGLAANMTLNPLEAVTTVTAQIVALLVGDQEFDSAKTLAAFGLGLTLFVITLALNIIALVVVRRYRARYAT